MDLLIWKVGHGVDVGVRTSRAPDIGGEEISAVDFMVHCQNKWGKRFSRSSYKIRRHRLVDDRFAGNELRAHFPLGEGAVEVMVRQVVSGGTRYLLVNRVYGSICQLQDGNESARPKTDFSTWCPEDATKVRLFVLVYL